MSHLFAPTQPRILQLQNHQVELSETPVGSVEVASHGIPFLPNKQVTGSKMGVGGGGERRGEVCVVQGQMGGEWSVTEPAAQTLRKRVIHSGCKQATNN